MSAIADYFLNYHELVLNRIRSGQTGLYQHQIEALLAIYQKAARGEMSDRLPAATNHLQPLSLPHNCNATRDQRLHYLALGWLTICKDKRSALR